MQDDAERDSKEEWVESRIGTFQKDAGHSFLPVKLSLSTSVFFKWESPSASSCSLPSSFPPRHPHHSPWHPITTQVLLMFQMPGSQSPKVASTVLSRHGSGPYSLTKSQRPAVLDLPKFRKGTSKSQAGRIWAGLSSL